MNHPMEFRPSFRLGDWTVHPGLNRIAGEEDQIQVEPRVMQVLLRLAETPGEVVSRYGLLEDVWGDAIVGEENLTRAISELRRIFGDSARRPNYIETIRQHGYRLIANVGEIDGGIVEVEDEAPVEPDLAESGEDGSGPVVGLVDETIPESIPESIPEPTPESAPEFPSELPPVPEPTPEIPVRDSVASEAPDEPARRQEPRRRPLLWIAAAVLVIAVVAILGPKLWDRTPNGANDRPALSPAAAPAVIRAVPLTSLPGREWHPALSPDGTRTAFVWAGTDGDNADIYLKQRNSETILRLSDGPGWAAWPAWAPDGQTVAFVQQQGARTCLCTVPSLGGAVRTLLEIESWIEGVDWAPDGGSLVFSAAAAGESSHRLQRLDLASLRTEPIPIRRTGGSDDILPRISPDGSTLAWIGISLDGSSGVFSAPLAGGEARRLAAAMTDMQGLAWDAGGSSLVYAQARGGIFGLWRLALTPAGEAGEAVPLSLPGDFAWNPASARGVGDLAYEQVRIDQDIWRLQILDRNPWNLETTPFLRSTRWESAAAYSPDGSRVVFVSSRSGAPELWTCDAGGENLQRLTEREFGSVDSPRWSPDGRLLAANVVRGGTAAVIVVAARGGEPRFLDADAVEVFSDWTRDGRLLVSSDRGDGWQVYERDPDTGESRPRTTAGGIAAREAGGDGALFYLRPGRPGLWSMVPGAEPELVVPDLAFGDRRNWALLDGAVAWVLRDSGRAFLVFQDLATGETSIVAELPDLAEAGLGISPDESTVFFTRTRAGEGDLMLLRAGAESP